MNRKPYIIPSKTNNKNMERYLHKKLSEVGEGGDGGESIKYTEQELTAEQQTQARENIGAGTYRKPSSGIPANDLANGVILVAGGSGQNSAQQIGSGANASGDSSFAENSGKASGLLSHAEGSDTTASGNGSHAEGQGTIASGNGSHAEGVGYNDIYTTAGADSAHAEGAGVVVKGQAAHGEGLLNVAGRTQEEAVAALADFHNLSGTTEQKVSKLIGFASHSEGSSTRALGTSSHAEGNSTQALVNATHAEGDSTTASGEAAHSEGYNTTASGNQAHAEGYNTEATANQAHAEGKYTEATSENAHAEGNHTTANGNASHTEGYYTVANNNVEHAEGQYNVSNKASTTFGNAGNTIHSVGIGTSNARKNAFEIMQNGDAYLLGIGGYDGTNPASAQTVQQELAKGEPVASAQPQEGFLPNVFYNLGELTGNITFALATPSDNTIVNHYYWTFETGSTAPTITWPNGITWLGGSAPEISASKHYEISVLNGIGTFMEV